MSLFPLSDSSGLWSIHRPWGRAGEGKTILIENHQNLTFQFSDYEQCEYLGTWRVQCSHFDKGVYFISQKISVETKKKMTLKAELKTLLGPASSDFHCLQNIPGKGSPEYL